MFNEPQLRKRTDRISSCNLLTLMILLCCNAMLDATEPVRVTQLERLSEPLVRKDLLIESAASCAATACHGGPRAGVSNAVDLRGSEYPLWLERDPHARSWQTICSDASVTIMERLRIMQSGQIVDRPGFDNCLACHNSTLQFNEPRNFEHLREGVGCNACHGPSERWRGEHFGKLWSASGAENMGFVHAENMLTRARMCATCHIGDRDRDMNHDIIAAGHPALHYEFATFHQRQPKHWRDVLESDQTIYEASQWLCGQVAGFDASLLLLEIRASKSHSVSVWPELSALDCAACHQKIRLAVPDYSSPKAASSTANWSQWNRFGVHQLLHLRRQEGKSGAADQRLSDAIDHLSDAMANPRSSGQEISEAARLARYELDEWLRAPEIVDEFEHFTAHRLQQLAISAAADRKIFEHWETATQFYLASVAGRTAWPKLSSGEDVAPGSPLATARQLRSTLTFARGSNSPQDFFRTPNVGGKPGLRSAGIKHWDAIRHGKIELHLLIEPTP